MTDFRLHIRGIVAVALIAIVAISISLVSYAYATYNAQRISELATNEIRTNSNVKAHDVSKIIENKIDKVDAVLKTLATAPAIHNVELPRANQIIVLRQDSTKEITDGYFWLDKDGKLLYSSQFAANQSLYDKFVGTDLSSQSYFMEPKKTGNSFFSSIIEAGEEKIPKLYISMPIMDTIQAADGSTQTVFEGIVGAGIKTTVLADLVRADLSMQFQSDTVILDKKGIIMYSTNASSIGTNVLSQDYRSHIHSLAPESKGAIDSLLSDLQETRSGLQDIKFGDTVYTFSYSPVKVEGENFLMLYVYSPHTLTTEVNLLVDQQRTTSAIIIAAIAAGTLGVGILIVFWNRRLASAVEDRTKELKEKSEQLLAHDKLQTEFINIAAHELRTPVQPLLGISEQLEEELEAGREVKLSRPEVEMLARNAKRLVRLTSDILEVSRIESNSVKLNKEKVDLKEKIQKVIGDTQSFIVEGKNLKIVFEDATKDPVTVYADRSRLFEVISNLLRNAIKFTDEGIIRIRLEANTDGFAKVSIIDNGKGIGPDIFPKLFTKFVSKSDSGTGLGLYISKNIIEAHGGKIWADNNPEGKGAIFTFTIPVLTAEEQRRRVEND